MIDKLEIANKVFLNLGLGSESSLDSDSTPMRLFNASFDDCLKSLLVRNVFSFSLKEHILTKDPDSKDNTYLLPFDCLRIYVMTSGYNNSLPILDYEVVGNKVKTNAPVPKITYISNVNISPPSQFIRALVFYIAMEINMSLTQNHDNYTILKDKYLDAIETAILANQTKSKFVLNEDVYLSRWGYSGIL